MILGRNGQFGAANGPFGHPQAFESLRAGDLVNQMQIDIKYRLFAGFLMDDVLVPNFFEQSSRCVCNHGLYISRVRCQIIPIMILKQRIFRKSEGYQTDDFRLD